MRIFYWLWPPTHIGWKTYDIALLKCASSYPAPFEEANMVMINDMALRYGIITGLSDHTIGNTVPNVAAAFGAKIIEKHFILDRSIVDLMLHFQ